MTVAQRPLSRPLTTGHDAFTGVRWALGLLLALAATLKAIQFVEAPPMARLGPVLWILAEVWMALWLVSGLTPRWAWTAALVLFGGLAGVSGWEAAAGEASCGCFGNIHVSPWITLALDAGAIVALLLTRPARANISATRGRLVGVPLAGVLAGAVLLIYLLTRPAVGLSPAGQIATNPASTAAAGTLLADLGYVTPKSTHPLHFVLVNPSNRAMAITRIEKECGCTQLPATLPAVPPHGQLPIDGTFAAPDLHAPYAKRIVLFTDSKETPTLVLQVRARIGLPLRIEPEHVDLGPITPGQPLDCPFTLINDGDAAVQLLFAVSTAPEVTIPTPRARLEHGQKLELRLQGTAPAQGSPNLMVRLQTDATDQPVLEIPVQYTLRAAGTR